LKSVSWCLNDAARVKQPLGASKSIPLRLSGVAESRGCS
jgi:hypothetical protein